MDNIKPSEIVEMYNNGMTLKNIGEKIGKSKSSIQRIIVNNGYVRNNETGKYEKQNSNEENILDEPIIEIKPSNYETNVSHETIKNAKQIKEDEMVNRTYAISKKIERAIKIKSAIEGKKPVDIVREALDNYIDEKYKVL